MFRDANKNYCRHSTRNNSLVCLLHGHGTGASICQPDSILAMWGHYSNTQPIYERCINHASASNYSYNQQVPHSQTDIAKPNRRIISRWRSLSFAFVTRCPQYELFFLIASKYVSESSHTADNQVFVHRWIERYIHRETIDTHTEVHVD